MPAKGHVKNLANQRFGRVTIISLSHIDKNAFWLCRCDCGKEFTATGNNVVRGKQVSCGCYKKEVTGRLRKSHGETNTRFYRIWAGMKKRVLNKNDKRHGDYGGRGIAICEDWFKYELFKRDMHQSYLEHVKEHGVHDTTIERIDVDGDYTLSNCKWATYQEQNMNTRKTVVLSYQGVNYSLAEAAIVFNINKSTLKDRLRRGMSLELALTTPTKKNREGVA
jgi:hypothetical protein